MARILDVCCGSRMFWFDKSNGNVTYMDNRELNTTLCDGRELKVKPDIVADFRHMPFLDQSFNLVVFDPPHLKYAGKKSWLALKYGKLSDNWQDDIKRGFAECFRVLKVGGFLIFKWSEVQIKTSEVLKLCDYKPLFGSAYAKTRWIVFMK